MSCGYMEISSWTRAAAIAVWRTGWDARGIDVQRRLSSMHVWHGMTIAAAECIALGEELGKVQQPSDLTSLAARFQRKTARIIRGPWLMATSTDLSWSEQRLPAVVRAANWYNSRVLDLIPGDARMNQSFARVLHMIDSPAHLLRPGIAWRVAVSSISDIWKDYRRSKIRIDSLVSGNARSRSSASDGS
jgi:hypothetical protein